jgi:hypothetical protein
MYGIKENHKWSVARLLYYFYLIRFALSIPSPRPVMENSHFLIKMISSDKPWVIPYLHDLSVHVCKMGLPQ